MVDLLKVIVKWLIIALIIFLLIFIIANIVNGSSKKKANNKVPEIETINKNYDYDTPTDNSNNNSNENNNTNTETSVVNSPDTGIKEDITIWLGILILSVGGYYIYLKKRKQA